MLDSMGSPVVVYHWDADGIASAAMLLKARGWGRLVMPRPGEYRVEKALPQPLPSGDGLVVVDYAVGGKLGLARSVAGASEIVYVDHHRVECSGVPRALCCNPLPMAGLGEEDVPSTSMLLYWLHDSCCPDLAAVGLVGDNPKLPAAMKGFAVEAARAAGLEWEEFKRAVRVVDSCYVIPSAAGYCAMEAVELLAHGGPAAVLESRLLRGVAEEAARLEARAVEEAKASLRWREGVVYAEVSVDALVTSRVGRLLAREHPDAVAVVVHRIPSLNKWQVYIRSLRLQVGARLSRVFADSGLEAGGKDYVFVVHCYSREELEKALALVEGALAGLR